MPSIATIRDIAITIAAAAITAGGISIFRQERSTYEPYTEARNEQGETHMEQMQRESAESHAARMTEQARDAERTEELHQVRMERARNGHSYY